MKETQNKPQKPNCLQKKEAAQMIERAINAAANMHSLSFCDIEDILFRFWTEAKNGADREIEKAAFEYKQQMTVYQSLTQKEKKEAEQDGTDHCSSDT